MARRISRFLTAYLLAVLAVVLAALPALAADFRSGNEVTVASGEVINDDLYVAGGNLRIDGTVNGDLLAAGGTVTIKW